MVGRLVVDDERTREVDPELQAFVDRAEGALASLFDTARAVDEFQFAFCLIREMRGMQDSGWNTAEEANLARHQYLEHLATLDETNPMSVRISLSLYAHLSEASGLYEVPKNLLRVSAGEFYSGSPFVELVDDHKTTGEKISPNANKVMKDLLGHATDLGALDLVDVILEAFDADIRNGYAHADYIVARDGIRLRRRNGGLIRVVDYQSFARKLNRAVAFFEVLNLLIDDAVRTFSPAKLVFGRMNSEDPSMWAVISVSEDGQRFGIKTGGDIGPHTDPMSHRV